MKEIKIPKIDWNTVKGRALTVPVKVNWPELQLTMDQMVANGIAAAYGKNTPYPDPSIINVTIERPDEN